MEWMFIFRLDLKYNKSKRSVANNIFRISLNNEGENLHLNGVKARVETDEQHTANQTDQTMANT